MQWLESLYPAMAVSISDNLVRRARNTFRKHTREKPGFYRLAGGQIKIKVAAGNVGIFLRNHAARANQCCTIGIHDCIAGHVVEMIGNEQQFHSRNFPKSTDGLCEE